MKTLPKTLWITLEGKGTKDEFILASTHIENIEDGELVGEYKQVSLNKKRVIHDVDLVIKRKNRIKNK